jgi:hypothetical protein
MKKTALLTTALILLASTSAQARVYTAVCIGKITVDTTAVSRPILGSIEIDPTGASERCFIFDRSIIKRLLKVCPAGSECTLILKDNGYRKTHYHAIGPVYEITKHPSYVERSKP